MARKGEAVLAVGSPGADRITTAVALTLLNHLHLGLLNHRVQVGNARCPDIPNDGAFESWVEAGYPDLTLT